MRTSTPSRSAALAAALLSVAGIVGTLLVGPTASAAADPTVNEVTLTAPEAAVKRAPATFTVATRLRVGDVTTPAAGVQVVLESWRGADWVVRGDGVSDESGRAEIVARLDDRDVQTFRARTVPAQQGADPVTSSPVDVAAGNQRGDLAVDLAATVNDGADLPLSIRWTTPSGTPIPGRVQVHTLQQGVWTIAATLSLDDSGTTTIRIAPRWDSTWYVTGDAGPWYDGARSTDHVVDNIPPGTPVVYPTDAPVPPVVVPEQPRATTPGAHPVITRIPAYIWRSMVGVSWHRGCPVGRARLRLLRINYWGFDGYRHQGQLIASTRAIKKFRAALVDLYNRRYPIRSMYLADYFGYSSATGGADDFTMMAAGNTSAFNCRRVDNARRISPHSYGTSIDVNTWENPYWSALGVIPNIWWPSHELAPVTARRRTDLLVRVFARHGVRWTYRRLDSQHFDA